MKNNFLKIIRIIITILYIVIMIYAITNLLQIIENWNNNLSTYSMSYTAHTHMLIHIFCLNPFVCLIGAFSFVLIGNGLRLKINTLRLSYLIAGLLFLLVYLLSNLYWIVPNTTSQLISTIIINLFFLKPNLDVGLRLCLIFGFYLLLYSFIYNTNNTSEK